VVVAGAHVRQRARERNAAVGEAQRVRVFYGAAAVPRGGSRERQQAR